MVWEKRKHWWVKLNADARFLEILREVCGVIAKDWAGGSVEMGEAIGVLEGLKQGKLCTTCNLII